MKVNIVHGYGLNDVRQINKIINSVNMPILNNKIGEFNENEINLFVCDYTPVQTGDILIKYPNSEWKKLKANSIIIKEILKRITYREPHCFKKQNIMASIHLSKITNINIKD